MTIMGGKFTFIPTPFMSPKTKSPSVLPEKLVLLLEMTNKLNEEVNKPRLTPAEKRALKRQLPGISRLLIEAHGAVLAWFGGSDVWDGMMHILEEAKAKLSDKKKKR